MSQIGPPIAGLYNMGNPAIPAQWKQFQTAAAKLGIEPQLLDILKPEDIAPAFDAAIRQHADAIIVQPDALTQQNRTLIVDLGSQSSTVDNLRIERVHRRRCSWPPTI